MFGMECVNGVVDMGGEVCKWGGGCANEGVVDTWRGRCANVGGHEWGVSV